MRLIDRRQEIPHEGAFCDLMWSDPEDIEDWSVSPRGAGWLFGSRVTAEFCNVNGLELVTRCVHAFVRVWEIRHVFSSNGGCPRRPLPA
mmetsp:Transcript_60849/g.162771  ORF Transcript_60849/g.162771 Transcript_60849/m.162771 type:complete len:89 (-) Transcript_60849:1090-1356(-)